MDECSDGNAVHVDRHDGGSSCGLIVELGLLAAALLESHQAALRAPVTSDRR